MAAVGEMSKAGNNDNLEPTLPRHCYLDEDFLGLERQHIFSSSWFCVARAADLQRVGEYRALDVGGESIFIVRSAEDTWRAFHNVCRHRGSQLVGHRPCTSVAGHFGKGIRCPYHSWFYSLDGDLLRTPHLDVEPADLGLHEIELAEWGGFLFLRLTADAGSDSLPAVLGDIPARVARYPLAELRTGKSVRYEVAANWKVILENYNECYHCAGVHPELCRIVPAFRERGGTGLDWDRGVPHRDGANTFTMSGRTRRQPFAGLNDDERERHKGELIYPNLMLSLAMDHAAAFTLWPRAADRTDIVCDLLFHPDEMARDDFDPGDAFELWDLTNRQDWAICESVQRGMNSLKFEHGYYAPMEDLSLDIRDYVRRRLPDDTI